MRKSAMMLDAGDKRAVASGAAVAFGVVTVLALRADWLLVSDILHFQHTGQEVAASVLGYDLLPWTMLFTAAVATGAVLAAAFAVGATEICRDQAWHSRCDPGGRLRSPLNSDQKSWFGHASSIIAVAGARGAFARLAVQRLRSG